MEAHSSNAQEIFGPDWDPTAADVLVGDITSTVRDSENGRRLVAEDNGVQLWADILNGNAIDYHAFDVDGKELGIATFIEPDAPGGPGVPGVPGVPQGRCHWVCVWGYGGRHCWRKCP